MSAAKYLNFAERITRSRSAIFTQLTIDYFTDGLLAAFNFLKIVPISIQGTLAQTSS